MEMHHAYFVSIAPFIIVKTRGFIANHKLFAASWNLIGTCSFDLFFVIQIL